MKKLLALLLALCLMLGCAAALAEEPDTDLVAAAKAEGTLTVYGSCEEDYLVAACNAFTAKYGIEAKYLRKSTGEVPNIIDEELGKDKTGTGLGLAITKEIIKAHHEVITVTSKVGEGTEFVFTLSKASAASASAGGIVPAGGQKQ